MFPFSHFPMFPFSQVKPRFCTVFFPLSILSVRKTSGEIQDHVTFPVSTCDKWKYVNILETPRISGAMNCFIATSKTIFRHTGRRLSKKIPRIFQNSFKHATKAKKKCQNKILELCQRLQRLQNNPKKETKSLPRPSKGCFLEVFEDLKTTCLKHPLAGAGPEADGVAVLRQNGNAGASDLEKASSFWRFFGAT